MSAGCARSHEKTDLWHTDGAGREACPRGSDSLCHAADGSDNRDCNDTEKKPHTALPSVHMQQDKGNEALPGSVGRAVHSQVSPSGVCCPPRAEEPWRSPKLAVTKVGSQSRSNYLSQTGRPGATITQERAVKEKPILRSLHSLLSAWIPRGCHSLHRILGAFPFCWIFC